LICAFALKEKLFFKDSYARIVARANCRKKKEREKEKKEKYAEKHGNSKKGFDVICVLLRIRSSLVKRQVCLDSSFSFRVNASFKRYNL